MYVVGVAVISLIVYAVVVADVAALCCCTIAVLLFVVGVATDAVVCLC